MNVESVGADEQLSNSTHRCRRHPQPRARVPENLDAWDGTGFWLFPGGRHVAIIPRSQDNIVTSLRECATEVDNCPHWPSGSGQDMAEVVDYPH
jgi:hypothetical protein